MYDMTRMSGNGYYDSEDKEESHHLLISSCKH